MSVERWRRGLPGLWAGALIAFAAVATPAAFALLPQADAGRVVARILAQEAHASLALGALLVGLERVSARRFADEGGPQFTPGLVLALLTVFCTVLGYFALQPLMAAARAGQGSFSFGQLHAVSALLYAVKLCAVLALTWRAARPGA
jgi:hypothetical protein